MSKCYVYLGRKHCQPQMTLSIVNLSQLHISLSKGSSKMFCGMQKEIGCKDGGMGQEPVSYFSIRLSQTHVEMNKMCLKSISVVISFPNIKFKS